MSSSTGNFVMNVEVDDRLHGDMAGAANSPSSGSKTKKEPADGEVVEAFSESKDKWSFPDADSKGFFLDTTKNVLYCWDPGKSLLYEYDKDTGNVTLLWNAYDTPYLWPMLEWRPGALPPPDPQACLDAWTFAQPQLVMFLNGKRFTPVREHELDDGQIAQAVNDFQIMHQLSNVCIARLQRVSKVGQVYVMRKFKPQGDEPSKSFARYMDVLERNDSFAPGGLAERSMRLSVDMNGGVLGPHIAELAGYPGLGDQHVQISFLNSRFCVCDLGSDGGTWLNDDKLEAHQWTELPHGATLRLGAECYLGVELSDFAIEALSAASAGVPLVDPASVGGMHGEEAGGTSPVGQEVASKPSYKDRAAARRERGGDSKNGARDGLNATLKRQLDAVDAEERKHKKRSKVVEEGHMREDGSFMGQTMGERAGLGFAASQNSGPIVDRQAMSRSELGRHTATQRYEKIDDSPPKKPSFRDRARAKNK